jgi:hypothetical protein
MELGIRWRATMRSGEAPSARAALDELLLAQGEELRPHQARHRHPAEAADDDDDQDEDADLRADPDFQRVAEEIDDQQEQRKLGQATGRGR